MKHYTISKSVSNSVPTIDRVEEMLKGIRMNSSLLFEIKSSLAAGNTMDTSDRKRLLQTVRQLIQLQKSCHTKILMIIIATQFSTLSVLAVSLVMERV